ncbi:hypothetical protein [Anaeroselena agilis]|uniref:Anaerobic ribonucleoside-triphosphate reductase n=1 Tax=Anaeroselena agilis TaxID=3063788 RepID=A0ABU3NW55_9FIRM|nr:anaerobic ribonucleoside-triphosphate reductase [Selenomonadales bacterium 4137-cl]
MKFFICPESQQTVFPSKCQRDCEKTGWCEEYMKVARTGSYSMDRLQPKGVKTRTTRDYNGIPVKCPEGLTEEEFQTICAEEVELWKARQRAISTIEISVDGDELVVFTREKSPIKRLRRITGYLSDLTAFNDAKQAEEAVRYKHVQPARDHSVDDPADKLREA